jgi:hypothetical protein
VSGKIYFILFVHPNIIRTYTNTHKFYFSHWWKYNHNELIFVGWNFEHISGGCRGEEIGFLVRIFLLPQFPAKPINRRTQLIYIHEQSSCIFIDGREKRFLLSTRNVVKWNPILSSGIFSCILQNIRGLLLQILDGRTLKISKFLNSENVVLFLESELLTKKFHQIYSTVEFF